jgi:hypothetical protein
MKKSKASKPSSISISINKAKNVYFNVDKTATPDDIYIVQFENLPMDSIELATLTHIHIKEVKNLHISKTELVTHTPTAYQQPAGQRVPTNGRKLTNSQFILACYYTLVSWGIQPRVNIDIAPVARFIHFAIGKPYTSITNSEFYKKLQRVPNFKSERDLIKDLEVVKSLFLQLELKEVVILIDQELTLARQEIKHHSK